MESKEKGISGVQTMTFVESTFHIPGDVQELLTSEDSKILIKNLIKEAMMELESKKIEKAESITQSDLAISTAGAVGGFAFLVTGAILNSSEYSLIGLSALGISLLHLRARSKFIKKQRKKPNDHV